MFQTKIYQKNSRTKLKQFSTGFLIKLKKLLIEKEEQLEEELERKVEEIKDDLTEKVDSYLNYVSESTKKMN